MSDSNYETGMTVVYRTAPQWGPGKVIAVHGRTIIVRFEYGGTREFGSTDTSLEISRGGVFVSRSLGTESYESAVETYVAYFAKPDKIYSLAELEESPPPSRPGVYGWYFDKSPPYVRNNGCTRIKTGRWPFRTKWWLLYIGQADKLKDRIMRYHIGGGHYAEGTMSSFRLSLGCLLSDKYGLILHYPPESFGKKDRKLNKWLEEHARIAWVETENLDEVELDTIEKYTLPLNHKHNQHPLKYPLSKLRTEFKNIAKSQKPKKKYFRKAYKKFVKECKALRNKK